MSRAPLLPPALPPELLPELRPWIEQVWVSARADAAPAHAREHSLPSGSMHLAIRLDGPPLRLYADAADRVGRDYAAAVVGGVRAAYCIKDTSQPAASLGAVLRPGAALALFGVSAAELEGRHVNLRDLCGSAAECLYERLAASPDPIRRRRVFERFLRERLRAARFMRGVDPRIADALQRLHRAPFAAEPIAALAEGSGRSHRHFIAGFRDAVGLAPKRYVRVLRFKRALQALSSTPRPGWAQLALEAGYFDQSHLIREFRQFAGVSPREFVAAAPVSALHLPLRQG